MKNILKNIILLFFIFLFARCSQQQIRTLPPLKETYNKDDKKPFGAYVSHDHFKKLFDDRYIETNDLPFNIKWESIKEYSTDTSYSLYVLITQNLSLTTTAAIAMADYVKEGNDLFIAADYIDMQLQAQINIATEREEEIAKELKGLMHSTSVKMDFGNDFKAPAYGYYYYPFLNYFDQYDSSQTRVLGVNETGKPNYIVMFIGKGRLYLHAAPRAFSNYFLLTADNHKYLENVLSYLRPEPKNIYWDEYYSSRDFSNGKTNASGKSRNKDPFSSFKVITKNPPLLWASWLAIIALLLYVVVNIKRKQRVINEIKPNTNATVTFTETVGRLYLQKKNNKNIAEKMITYFYEHVRNNYFLNTSEINSDFINTVSRKSGVAIDLAQNLFSTIDKIQASQNVNDAELLALNKMIQKFYNIKPDGRKFI